MRVLCLSVLAALAVSAGALGVTTASAATATATVLSLQQAQASFDDPPSLSNPTLTLDGSLLDGGTSAPIAHPEWGTSTEQGGGAGPAGVVATTTPGPAGSFTVTFSKLTATGNFTAS